MDTPLGLTPEQFNAVSVLLGPKRYAHTVKRAADTQLVWGLRDAGGWASLAGDEGHLCFPVWPHPQYAQACIGGEWKGNTPAAVGIHEFLDSWLPDMAVRGVAVAVFPTPELRGVYVTPAQFANDLRDELSRFE